MIFSFKFFLCIFATSSILLLPRFSFGTERPYYYLHVESFRNEKNALQSVKNFQQQGLPAVIKKIGVAKLGDWYRVYIGPFSSQQEAQLKAAELKKRGIVEYAAVKKTDALIAGPVVMAAPTIKKKVPPKAQQPQPAVTPGKTAPQKPPPTAATSQAAPSQTAPVKKPAGPSAPVKKTQPPIPKTSKTISKKGKGRNVSRGSVAVGYSHTYREIDTELIERLEIKTNGGTTTTPKPVEDIKNDFPTSLHLDSLYLKLGVTDYFEIFAQGGMAYDKLDDPGYVYGGGLRLNLFQTSDRSPLPGFYAALQGVYLAGEIEEDFTSINGNKFERTTDWQEISAGVEIGISHRGYVVYIGGNYFIYTEDTERRQLEGLPAGETLVFVDELEQENDIGLYGGISVNLTKALWLNIEGRVIDQESIFGALEYRF